MGQWASVLRGMLEPMRARLDTGASCALDELAAMLDQEPAAIEEVQRHEDLIEGIRAIWEADRRDRRRR